MAEMTHVEQLLKGLPAAQVEEGKQRPSALSTKTIEHLFAKLLSIYGTKFADLWSGVNQAEMKATWAEALGCMAMEELRAGLTALVRSGSPFPPTLPEFYQHCRPAVAVPPVTDHAGLDRLAANLGVSNANCVSYHDFRARILAKIEGQRTLPRLT